MTRTTVRTLLEKKRKGEKIAMLTAYDFPLAQLLDREGIDMILVGDSGGMVQLGYENTLPVTLDQMLVMVQSVRRGAPNTFVIADLPFLSYQVSREEAVRNAGSLVKHGGADAVKLEGGVRMADTVKAIIDAGIAVQGHIGLTPQNAVQLGGYRVQGKDHESARALLDDAAALERAGVFSLVLEAVPIILANYITENISVPTIGTGAGGGCDGQNLITPDMLGYFDRFTPKYVRRYADISTVIRQAVASYKQDVVAGLFPAEAHTYAPSDEAELRRLISDYVWSQSRTQSRRSQ